MISITIGFGIALSWIYVGWSNVISEAAPGILTGLAVNYIVVRIQSKLDSETKLGLAESEIG
ncbi:MAG: hypothetical protein CMQ20_13590 [Gammaproteobacteria bacterium]|nr:hypothetical protein [Gammaproteobacteria bacterium]